MSLVHRLRRRLAQQSGFTLIELLVGAAVGTVIVGVAFGLLDSVVRTFGSSEQRVDVSQRGRQSMDRVTQLLRSQACHFDTGADKWQAAMISGTKDKVVFWSDLGEDGTDKDGNGRTTDGRRVRGIEYTAGRISQLNFPGTGQSATGTPESQVLATDVAANNGPGLFRYFAYNPAAADPAAGASLYTELSPPLGTADLARVVRVTVNFTAYPERSDTSDKMAADFTGDFLSRTAASPYEFTAPPAIDPAVLEPRCE